MRNLLPRRDRAFRARVDAVVNSASTFEHDTARRPSASPHWKNTCAANAGAAILLAQALHTHILERQAQPTSEPSPGSASPRGAVVNLLDQKLWNQNPDFLSYTLVQGSAGSGHHHAGAWRWRRTYGVVGVAPGLTMTTSRMMSQAQVRRAATSLALLDTARPRRGTWPPRWRFALDQCDP